MWEQNKRLTDYFANLFSLNLQIRNASSGLFMNLGLQNFFTDANNSSEHIFGVSSKSQIFDLHHLGNKRLIYMYD